MTPCRRKAFLGGLVAAAAGPLWASGKHSAFEPVTLGKTGIVTTRLGFGTGVHAYDRACELVRRNGEEGAVKILRGAYDRGIRYFDLADSYGTHALAAKALKGVPREKYVLGSKYWWAAGGIPAADHTDVMTSIDRFLRELRTDYVDCVELHCVTSPTWPKDLERHLEGLARAKKAGKIRSHGCSFHSYAALAAAVGHAWIDLAHVRLNPFGRNMTTHPERVMAKVRAFHAEGKGVIAMKVLGVGTLKDKPGGIDRSLKWNLDSNAVDILNIGFTSLEEVDDIVRRIGAIDRA